MQERHQGGAPVTVLVVDDDPEMRGLLRDFLEHGGFRVIEERSGERAIARAEAHRVDAVVVDREMPGASGLEVLLRLRRRLPGLPVILITAFGGSRVREEALRLGASRYLEKPFRVAELVEALRAMTTGGGGFLSSRGRA